MGRGFRLTGGAAAAAAVAAGLLLALPRNRIPGHLLGHHAEAIGGLLSPQDADALMELTKEMASFPTNSDYLKFYATRHEHIGEGVPIGAGQRCDHPFLIPSVNRTHCVLAGRIDIGRHFLTYGGVEGVKEPFEVGVSRLLSFGRYMFDPGQYPAIERLFADAAFQGAAKRVCPPGRQHLDPFQFNFIINVPGQSVAMHIDSPYFWGVSRFQVPEWLLAAMVFSGLWQDRFVDQVQVVAYYHRWNNTDGRDGKFVYWSDGGKPRSVPPTPLAGTAVDGSKTVHAASIYRGTPPVLDKSLPTVLRYTGDDRWELTNGGEKRATYTTDELRMTVVYRARCFEGEDERQRFLAQLYTQDERADGQLPLSEILATFRADLTRRGVLAADAQPALLDLAMMILKTYVAYPLPPEALVPYNYCALPRLVPWLGPVLRPFC
eukprot:TRINITY_DN14521_c0_g1_i1.p1 TRINITY_DN14521_c0_g1~~TRINITY_DN14521_c0_g1_i1.p1  ORF type:complete len:434 (+),score=142.01 TRINITY_DN14521_c0_g1_i1:68-1369(+)